MPPRKRPLLDVLREKERRQQGRREDGVAPPPETHGGAALFLPTWFWPALGGLVLLVLGVWGLSKCSFGSGEGGPEPDQEQNAPAIDEGMAVLAITYDVSQEERAKQVGRSLRDDFRYDVRLMRNTGPDGKELRELYVHGSLDRDLDLATLLGEIQALSLPGQPNDKPFAGASLRLPPVE